jgi:hypothetical protein
LAEGRPADRPRPVPIPPEGRGFLLRNLCYEYWFSFEETQEDAIIAVLKTIQTWHEYKEIMEHLTSDGRRIHPKPASGPDDTYQIGERTLWEFLDGTQKEQYRYHRLRLFMDRCNSLVKEPTLHAAAIRDNGILYA